MAVVRRGWWAPQGLTPDSVSMSERAPNMSAVHATGTGLRDV